jgi:hypothetical protein
MILASANLDGGPESGMIVRHIEELHERLSRSDSLYRSYPFELETREREARRAAELLIRLSGSLTAAEAELARERMLDVVRNEPDWRGQVAQAVLNRLPSAERKLRHALAARLWQQISSREVSPATATRAADELAHLVPDLGESERTLLAGFLRGGDRGWPQWKCELAAYLVDHLELRNAQVRRVVYEITRLEGDPAWSRKHLNELLRLIPTLESEDVDRVTRQLKQWAASGPGWKREIAAPIVDGAAVRSPVALNPFTQELHHTLQRLRELRFGPSEIVPSFTQAAAHLVVLIVVCLLWPFGMATVVTASLACLIRSTLSRLQAGDQSLAEKMPQTIALAIYSAIVLPAVLLSLPCIAIGFLGTTAAGLGSKVFWKKMNGDS